MKKFNAIKFSQNKQDFLSLVLPLGVVNDISHVLVYKEDDNGYQRKPNVAHYNKIKRYALEGREHFIIPTSIILGIDKDQVGQMIEESGDFVTLNLESEDRNFRIVDGQHRIAGLMAASAIDATLLDFLLNVVIIITETNRKSVELEVFTSINSTSKRINIDLAILAKHDFEIKERKISINEINKHIAINTAFYLKENAENNIWFNGIKFDIHSDISLGIIGVSIFTESIKSIVEKYILDIPPSIKGKEVEGNELIKYCKQAKEVIGLFLLNVWNKIIRVKWEMAFKEDIVKNEEGELVKIFYSKDFYIQKGLGIKSLNPIIGDYVKSNGINEVTFDLIKKKIFASNVKIDDWRNGGAFSGFNSESGFKKIKNTILNNLES
jgi:DGQHR domain-containing protein